MIITQTGCGRDAEPVSVDKECLDTQCNVTVYGTGEYGAPDGKLDEEIAAKAIDEAFELCTELENRISKTITASDIYKINHANGEWVEVCDNTAELLRKGIEYSELSDGDFDITVGGLTALWDFQAIEPSLPDEAELSAAAQHVDYRCVELDGNRVRLSDPAAQLDLGGIAKGYIGDCMAKNLIENGVNSAIVNLGGNVVCVGGKPDGTDFNIGIETPYSDRTEVSGVLAVSDKTVVTSGVYERYFELDGKKYHHILDPGTGYPVETDVVAVTLEAGIGHSMDIDALGTICLIKGVDEGVKLIESLDGIEAAFTKTDGSMVKTGGMELE